MRRLVKRGAEWLLVNSGTTAAFRRLFAARRPLILAYHNIIPEAESHLGDLPLHLPRGQFQRQIDCLVEGYDIVPLPDILSPARHSRPQIAITFDDAYRGALQYGIEELSARGVPATVFVSPGLLGAGGFWWDAFAQPETGLSDRMRATALDECSGKMERVSEWCASRGVDPQPLPEVYGCATLSEIEKYCGRDRITIASHTWSHPNLSVLPDDVLREELAKPLAWLEASTLDVLPYVSYPYGLADARVEAIAALVGYKGGFMINGGRMVENHCPFALPRLNVPAGVSLNGFAMRAAGIISR